MDNTTAARRTSLEGFVFSQIEKRFSTTKPLIFNQYDNFTLVWIKQGSGMLYVDLESFSIHANTLYCVLPSQLYRLQMRGETAGCEIHFTKDFLSKGIGSLPSGLISPKPVDQIKYLGCQGLPSDEIEDIFEEMLLEYSNNFPSRSDMLHCLLSLVISYFERDVVLDDANRKASNDKLMWIKFIDSLEDNFRRQKQVREYAAELNVTPNYLTEVVRRVSGFSPRHHIHQRILLEAKRLAISSSRPAVKISFDLGFDNPFTFSKFFKTLTGKTFSDFRKDYSLMEC